MDKEMLVTIVAQGGAGALVLAGILIAVKWWLAPLITKVVAPMIVSAFADLTKAIRDAAASQAESARLQVAALEKQAEAIGTLTERIAHIEGRLDQRDDTPSVPIAAGTRDDLDPVNVRPLRGR